MDHPGNPPNRIDTLRVFETGVRVALEKMLTGRDYAGVEDILRALADQSSLPATSTEQKSPNSYTTEGL